jgi:hypothetical protein
MEKRVCSLCGKRAIAYRVEENGGKTYFCAAHLPDGEAPHYGERAPKPPPPRP